MLNKLRDSLEKIKESEDYKEWKNKHKDAYFCSAFLDKNEWRIDFYDPDSDKMSTFRFEDKVVFEEDSVFRKNKDKINELNLEKIKIDLKRVESIIEKLIEEKYKGEKVNKRIVILQHLDKQMWNIIYVMNSFNVLNVKIDAESGEIIHENIAPILSFKK